MMKTAIVLALVAVVAVSAISDKHSKMFDDFKGLYGRKYSSAEEEAKRRSIFGENMEIAERHQAANPHATFGVNEYSDMSAAEFKSRHSGEKQFDAMVAKRGDLYKMDEQALLGRPSSADWRKKGAVTYVKNQGQCGSCWSFSTTGNIEGQWYLAGNTLTPASEQEFVSCDTTDDGCNGGLMDNAFSWVVANRGGKVVTEQSYPYVSGEGNVPSCRISDSMPTAAVISGHRDIEHNEDQMATYLAANGPLSIGVDATSWQTYSGGIMTNCVSSRVDHGVLAVGYDTANSPPYWIIKNSWGPGWGEQGFIRVEFGTNQCLITSAPCTSLVSGSGPRPPSPPSPPSPPTPPTPPSPPSGATFTQYNCQNFLCDQGCQKRTFPQNQCLRTEGGGSAIVRCVPEGLQLTAYQSSDCQGASQSETQPVDQCLQDTSGTYIYNVCSNGKTTEAQPAKSNELFKLSPSMAKKLRQ